MCPSNKKNPYVSLLELCEGPSHLRRGFSLLAVLQGRLILPDTTNKKRHGEGTCPGLQNRD